MTVRTSYAVEIDFRLEDLIEFLSGETPYFKEETDGKKLCKGWLPATKTNKRFEYLYKIFPGFDKNVLRKVLKRIWEQLIRSDIFVVHQGQARLDWKLWDIEIADNVFICDKCGHIHHHNVKGKCLTINCNGRLEIFNKDISSNFDYYIKNYKNYPFYPMRISEHTAQLDRKEGQNLQRNFERGEINILSCSTTFELGVDIGNLQTVFLHNVPPRPNNYIQRAGRAGRTSDSVAFIITYVRRRSHDLKYFSDIASLIKGEIKPPAVNVSNIRIVKRHLNAIALSHFFKQHRELFGKLGEFRNKSGFNVTKKLPMYYSLLYAILEGTSAFLQIKRDDIDGVLYPINQGKQFKIVLYDNVPAGAGFMEKVIDNFKDILLEAASITSSCSCGYNTTCPSCLQNIYNEFISEYLDRGLAFELTVYILKRDFGHVYNVCNVRHFTDSLKGISAPKVINGEVQFQMKDRVWKLRINTNTGEVYLH